MEKGQVFWWMIFFLVMGVGLEDGERFCLAEELGIEQESPEYIHIMTYYPSPHGSYQELTSEVFDFKTTDGPPDRVFGREKKGMLYFDDDDGLQYYDGHDWKPVASDAAGSTTPLIMNEHTEGDCVSAGGSVISAGISGSSVNQCRFSRSSCPSGWTQYKNWSETEIPTASWHCVHWTGGAMNWQNPDTDCSWSDHGSTCRVGNSSDGGFSYCLQLEEEHLWSNTEQESCYYCGDGGAGRTCKNFNIFSTITQIGCY